MPINVVKELAALHKLSVGDLRERYTQLFQETTQARNRPWLIKRIIWRMQSLEQGGLSERALQRAKELAVTSDLRVTAPTRQRTTDGSTTRTIDCTVASSRTPLPGMLLTGDIDTMARLCTAIPALRRVNLGGVHHRAGRAQKLRYIFLTRAEEHELRAMAARGVEISAQDVPAARVVPLDAILEGEAIA